MVPLKLDIAGGCLVEDENSEARAGANVQGRVCRRIHFVL